MVCQFVYDGTNWIWVGHTNINTDTTYTAGAGLNLNGTQFVNAGVRAVGVGTENGTISVNTNGTTNNVSVRGLDDLAFIGKPSSNQTNQFLRGDGTWQTITIDDSFIFKGLLGGTGNIAALPDTHEAGCVAEAGTYAGQVCEIGDTIYCLADGTTADNAHWGVLQTNIDGAVVGPASSTVDHVATFTGSTGKAIKDSGYTIATSVPANAVFTDTTYDIVSTSASGLVPQLPDDDNLNKFLRQDGNWAYGNIPVLQVDSTSTSTKFTVTDSNITEQEYHQGMVFLLYNGIITSAANCTLNIYSGMRLVQVIMAVGVQAVLLTLILLIVQWAILLWGLLHIQILLQLKIMYIVISYYVPLMKIHLLH